jgi:hypothetical protein
VVVGDMATARAPGEPTLVYLVFNSELGRHRTIHKPIPPPERTISGMSGHRQHGRGALTPRRRGSGDTMRSTCGVDPMPTFSVGGDNSAG